MTRHHAGLPPTGFAPAEVLIPVYLHVQSRRAGKIKGEAKAPGHVDEIELTAWQWGAQASAAMNGTASMGRTQCTYRALTIYKRFDTATTALMWALARNEELREVRLTMRRPVSSDGVEEDVFTITLSDARVVALDQEVAANGSSREGVTFESKVVQTQYQSGKPRRLVVAHRLPAPQPAQKAIAPALGMGTPGGQVASDAGITPAWSFREASMAQRKLDDAKALAEYQARLANQPMQYAGPIDDAGNARAAMAQQRTANNLAAALGGPFVAAPMLAARAAGLDEHQVEQAGMLGLAALDAAGVKGGGTVTRLGTGARVRGVGRAPSPLLPAEGKVGTYGDLIAAGTKGDNITPHHIPSARHMEQYSVSREEGISINMEMQSPGVGGRHRETFTYGNSADVDLSSRDALAAGIRDARSIYQRDALYDAYIRQQLLEVVRQNKAVYPDLFEKKQ
jgi:type VI secretion system Hcp family effector